jgi:hypothetical protein
MSYLLADKKIMSKKGLKGLIAKLLSVAMIHYNFFLSFIICKTLVGLYSSPGLPLKEGWINGEKDNIIPRLAGSEKENFTLRGEKRRPGKTSVCFPKSKKGKI